MSQLRRTPLYDLNKAHGGRMVDFAGWEMPVQFTSIIEEHKAVRSVAGLFDASHMGEVTVAGKDAEAFLDYVLTNRVTGMEKGRVLYSLMCYETGGVVDDLLVYKRDVGDYLLCLNASNKEKGVQWLTEHVGDFEVEARDVSDDYALIALQGPKAFDILRHISDADFRSLRYYHFTEGTIGSSPCLISRTGYTGELGVELFLKPDYAEEVAEEILREGEGTGLVLAGLGARDSLRLEAGYSLYGHEISETISPVQANLMWTVKLKKTSDFIGKAAIESEKSQGPAKRIVFFRTGGRRIARQGTAVFNGDEQVGEVVSGTFSPMLSEAIGSALVNAECVQAELSVELGRKREPVSIVKPPFIELNPQA